MKGALVCFLVTLTVYLVTMPLHITLEDAGLFQTVCHLGGIGHPPGYPLFVLGCQGFVNLPFFSESVFAGNLLSALFASAASALLVGVAFELMDDSLMATLCGLAYGLSATLWSQAIIIEVYSLAALIFMVCLWLTLRYRRDPHRKWLFWLALVFGLGLSNHWPLQLLAAPALLLVLLDRRQHLFTQLLQPMTLLGCLLLLLLGLLPYLSLFQADPFMAVFGPVTTWQDFLNYVIRTAYSDRSSVAGVEDFFSYQAWLVDRALGETSLLLSPFVLCGIMVSFKRLPIFLAAAFLALYLVATLLLPLLLGFEFNDFRVSIYKPYPVIANIALAIWLMFGLHWLISQIQGQRIQTSIVSVIVAIVFIDNFGENNRRHDVFAEQYGMRLLAAVPENSVLFVQGDNGVGLVGYLHYVLGMRADLELRSWNNLGFSNRLISPFASDEDQLRRRSAFMDGSQKPVYGATPEMTGTKLGLVTRYGDEPGFECDGGNHSYIRYLIELDLEGYILDGHARFVLFGLLLDFSRQHVGLMLFGDSGGKMHGNAHSRIEAEMLLDLQQTFAGKLATLEMMINFVNDPAGKSRLAVLAEQAQAMMPPLVSRQVEAVLAEFRGRIAMLEPSDPEMAIRFLEQSMERFPSHENRSFCPLMNLYQQANETQLIDQLSSRYPQLTCE